MIQKAIITSIDYVTGNIKVRIPIFEVAGVSTQFITDATVCHEPGNFKNYVLNDVVYVGFENYEYNKPIILGKLFTGIPEDASNYSFNKDLKVTGSTELSEDTKIGNITYSELEYSVKKIKEALDIITETTELLNVLLPSAQIGEKLNQNSLGIYTTTNVNDIRSLFGLSPIETDEVITEEFVEAENIATKEDIKGLF